MRKESLHLWGLFYWVKLKSSEIVIFIKRLLYEKISSFTLLCQVGLRTHQYPFTGISGKNRGYHTYSNDIGFAILPVVDSTKQFFRAETSFPENIGRHIKRYFVFRRSWLWAFSARLSTYAS